PRRGPRGGGRGRGPRDQDVPRLRHGPRAGALRLVPDRARDRGHRATLESSGRDAVSAPGITGLAHVGIAVRSLGPAIERWSSLGFSRAGEETIESMGLKLAFLRA